jgi:acetyl-CoA acetyltransferase
MSHGAYWMQNARCGARMGDASLVDAVVGCLTDPFDEIHMGVTAENLGESHAISREAQDEFSLESHRRAEAAIDSGLFGDEIVPGELKTRQGTSSSRSTSTFAATPHSRCSPSSGQPSRKTARVSPCIGGGQGIAMLPERD